MNNFQEDIIPPQHDHIVAEYYCCYLCGHELAFSYKIDEHYQKITEQSACKSCGFKNKPQQFPLQ